MQWSPSPSGNPNICQPNEFHSFPLLWGVQKIKHGGEEAVLILSHQCVINRFIDRSKIIGKQNAVSCQS